MGGDAPKCCPAFDIKFHPDGMSVIHSNDCPLPEEKKWGRVIREP